MVRLDTAADLSHWVCGCFEGPYKVKLVFGYVSFGYVENQHTSQLGRHSLHVVANMCMDTAQRSGHKKVSSAGHRLLDRGWRRGEREGYRGPDGALLL